MPCALLNLLAHVVVDLHIKHICDQVECILIVLHFCVEACEVESVGQVVLVDFAEIFVPPCRDELYTGRLAGNLDMDDTLQTSFLHG